MSMYVEASGVSQEGPASVSTQTPLSHEPLQPVTGASHSPVDAMQTAGAVQKAARQGPLSSTAASSNSQSAAEDGVRVVAVAISTFERILPPVPGSMMRNAIVGVPLTTII